MVVTGVKGIDMLVEPERILDVGGWFIPFKAATHVADLMPYETRGAKLELAPLPGEKFTKDSWHQCDFLAPNLRLPYPDSYFDFVYCGQTIEDLKDPTGILIEMTRVGKRGTISCPSRIHEQTVGVADRKARGIGHPHHHWIVEVEQGILKLYSKFDSKLSSSNRCIPLLVYEREIISKRYTPNTELHWQNGIAFCFNRGHECEDRARQFTRSFDIRRYERVLDAMLRFGRRQKYKNRSSRDWWSEIVDASRPYSKIEIG